MSKFELGIEKFKLYGVFGFFRLVRDMVMSKLMFPGVKVIRYPFYIRGRGLIDFGEGFCSGVGLRMDAFNGGNLPNQLITLGKNVQVNDYVHIGAIEKITIGDDTLIASKVFISDHNHGSFDEEHEFELAPIDRSLVSKPVTIGSNVWLGEGVMVLPGVTIGDGAVIGAGSIVTKNIAAGSLAVGSPAKIIKKYNTEKRKWEQVL